MTAVDALLVAAGAAVGAPARLLVGHVLRVRVGAAPPAGTLVVNVLGSFALGLLVGGGAGAAWLALLGIGFCGAFTTFSTLALEVWDAVDDGRHLEVSVVVGLSLALGLGAAALGVALSG